MKVIIANRCDNSFGIAESKKDRAKFRKNDKFLTSSTKEAMTISKAGLVQISGGPKPTEKSTYFKDTIEKCPTRKGL